jgi:hypothetical protein
LNFDFLFGRDTSWMVVWQSCLFVISAVTFKAILEAPKRRGRIAPPV